MTTTDSNPDAGHSTATTSGGQAVHGPHAATSAAGSVAATGAAGATGIAGGGGGPAGSAVPRTGRAANITLWVLQVVAALLFVGAGAGKLAGDPAMLEIFNDIGWGDWLHYVTGVVEIAGAIGLLIPRLAGLAALGLFGVMLGAVVASALLGHPVLGAVVVCVLVGVLAWGRRGRTAELLRGLSSR